MAMSPIVVVVLVSLVAAVAADPGHPIGAPSASSNTSGEAGKPSLKASGVFPYTQCGGSGGACTGKTDAKCKDARWPLNQGGSCQSGLNCFKISPYYYGCDVKQPPTDPAPAFVPADFKQCGGIGGSCASSNAAKCKDAQWPDAQGGACKAGLKCFRISEYYRSCDVKQPPSR